MRKGTPRYPWSNLRVDVTADSTAITTFEHDEATYVANKWNVPKDAESIVIAFWGKDADSLTGSYTLYGRSEGNGPIMLCATGALTTGTRLITKDPVTISTETAYWVDTITNTAEWIKTPVIKDSGNNRICYLCLDAQHLADVYLEFSNVGGGGAEMTEVNAIICGLSS